MEKCAHFDQIREVVPSGRGCEECTSTGARWNELRLCLSCGHVGCCDDSDNQHATKHFHASGHPLMESFDPGETWGWCYVDKVYFDPMPTRRGGKRRSLWHRVLSRLHLK